MAKTTIYKLILSTRGDEDYQQTDDYECWLTAKTDRGAKIQAKKIIDNHDDAFKYRAIVAYCSGCTRMIGV